MDVIAVVICTGSLISGVRLIINTIMKAIADDDSVRIPANLEDTDFLYTIFGGIAVAWLATFELHKKFKELNN